MIKTHDIATYNAIRMLALPGQDPRYQQKLWPIDHSMTILIGARMHAVDPAAAARQDDRGGSRKGSKGNAVRALAHNAAAAPATVSGEPPTYYHWELVSWEGGRRR
jgi:hypothetical protein